MDDPDYFDSDSSNISVFMDIDDEFNPVRHYGVLVGAHFDDDSVASDDNYVASGEEEYVDSDPYYDDDMPGDSSDTSSEVEVVVSSASDENSSHSQSSITNEAVEQTNEVQSMVHEQSKSSQDKISTETTTSNDNQQEEAFSCTICLEGLTNTGSHKPACLKCGHIFGEKCIERWIKVGCNNEARRCPTCNAKASLKDIRILYAKQLIAVDTAELTALEIKLDQEQREKNIYMTEVEKYKVKNQQLNAEVDRLKNIIENTKSDLPSTSNQTSLRQCLKKINLCKNPGLRVMTYNKNSMMLVVGQHSDSPLFTNSHVIRKVNASILEPSNEPIYAHKKQIRDMSFHPNETNLLASVSLDKCIKLSDMVSNSVVSYLNVEEALWSCCWAGDNPNILIAGGQMGSLFYIDKRFIKLLDAQREQKYACVSLVSLPPSSSRSFINGGFLKTRMDAISVFEQDIGTDPPMYKSTPLMSLKGLWSSCSYDSQSNLLLSSSKPCGANKSIRHIVSKISDFNVEGSLVNPVVTFFGGDKATQLSRSCIVPSYGLNEDSIVCSYDEKSNNVKLFSVNSGNNIHNFHVKENILDLCPLNNVIMNSRRVVAGLSENSISIFSV